MPWIQEEENEMLWNHIKGECRFCIHYYNAESCPDIPCSECPCDSPFDGDGNCACTGADSGENEVICHRFIRNTGVAVCSERH
jgi:hypothetical protein